MTRVARRSVTAIKVSIIAKIEDSKYHKNRSFLQVAAKLGLEVIIDYPCKLLERITVTMPSEFSTCNLNFLQDKETNDEDKIHLLIYINASLTPTTNTPVKEKKTHVLGDTLLRVQPATGSKTHT